MSNRAINDIDLQHFSSEWNSITYFFGFQILKDYIIETINTNADADFENAPKVHS